jgi:inorganic phosphate transporter, PiT family
MRSRAAIAAPLDVALAWVLTLPAAMILSGCLYLVFSRLF